MANIQRPNYTANGRNAFDGPEGQRTLYEYVRADAREVRRERRDVFQRDCPAHDDTNPSLDVEYKNGRCLYTCRAGCDGEQVTEEFRKRGLFREAIDAIGDTARCAHGAGLPATEKSERVRAIKPPCDAPQLDTRSLSLKGVSPVDHWQYLDSDGATLCWVCRYEIDGRKEIRPYSWVPGSNGADGWTCTALEPRPLYNQHELAARLDAPVLIVEGEKTAEAARQLFDVHVVVTWLGGSGSVGKVDWTPLKGRCCTIWPDLDEAGSKAASAIVGHLQRVGAEKIRTIDLAAWHDRLPKGWDLADPLPAGMDVEKLIATAPEVASSGAAKPRGLAAFIKPLAELLEVSAPEREDIITPFIKTSSLSMVYAPRGLGKTWFALELASAISRAEAAFGVWAVPKRRRVLFVDGEMPLSDLQERFRGMFPNGSDYVEVLSSEELWLESRPLAINLAEDQERFQQALDALDERGRRPDLIIFDNLSSLTSGLEENDNSAQEELLHWLISLRHRGYAVLVVHHAGKDGSQRGASRREDFLDTSIALKPINPKNGELNPIGANFVVEFVKTRGKRPVPDKLEVELAADEQGELIWLNRRAREGYTETLLAVRRLKRAHNAGLEQETGRAPATIKRDVKLLTDKGWVEREDGKKNTPLVLTRKGFDECQRFEHVSSTFEEHAQLDLETPF